MYQENQYSNEEFLQKLKKRRNFFTLLVAGCFVFIIIGGFIPGVIGNLFWSVFSVLNGLCAGCGMLCINQYRYEKSCGAKKGGGLWWIALLIFGFIIIPFITVVILSKVKRLGELVIGMKVQR